MALGFILALLGIRTSIDKFQDEYNRNQARKDNALCYYDKHGNLRDIKTNECAYYITNEDGDRCVATYSGRIIENITYDEDIIKREQDYKKAMKNDNRTVYFYRSNKSKGFCKPTGDRYVDKKTGEIYVKRSIKFNFIDKDLGLIYYTADVYMDLSGKLIRQTDESIEYFKTLKGKNGYIQNSEELTLKCIKYYNDNREQRIKDGLWMEYYANSDSVH